MEIKSQHGSRSPSTQTSPVGNGKAELALPEPDALARALAVIDDQMLADIKRERAAGEVEPEDPNDLIDDGPDPLGIGFAWAGAVLPEKPTELPPSSPPAVDESAD